MRLKTFALIGLCVVSIPASAVAYYIHRDFSAPPPELTPRGHSEGKASVGDYQFDILTQITRDFIAGHADASPAMRAGKALAPLDVLNAGLEQRHEAWRVREVHGIVAETFDVVR